MTGLLVSNDPPTRDERKAVRAAVEETVSPLVEDVALAEPARCIASGGTAGALARVLAARRWGARRPRSTSTRSPCPSSAS